MVIRTRGCERDLELSVDDGPLRYLAPDGESYTLGRLPAAGRHLFLGPRHGRTDRDVSRRAMSFRSRDGVVWKVRNESRRRPLAIYRRGQCVDLLPPRSEGSERPPSWVVDEDGVMVELRTVTGVYRVTARRLHEESPEPLPVPDPLPPSPDPSSGNVPTADPKDRIILGAKFLSRRQPSRAIGDRDAAERIARAFEGGLITTMAPPARPWGERVVEAAVVRWRQHLTDDNVVLIAGRANIDRLGWWLVYGYEVITVADRLRLPSAPEPEY